jgi:acetyl esterase
MPLDPQIQALLSAMAALNAPSMSEGTPDAARASFRFLTVDMRSPQHVIPVKESVDLVVDAPHGDLRARLYRPDRAGPVPTVVFFHGGGFVIGDIETHDNQCRALCRGSDSVVLSVDYRLAPEAPWPAGVDDCYAALMWAAEHVRELGGDPDRLAVAGDSAGGNLAAVVAHIARDEDRPALAAQLLLYPSVDMNDDESAWASRIDNAEGYFLTADDMRWFREHYLGGTTQWRDPRLSPLYGTHEGLPPAVIATAEFDPLRDEAEAYAEALRRAGVDVDAKRYAGMIHGFFDMGPLSAAAQAASDDVIARFRTLLWSP